MRVLLFVLIVALGLSDAHPAWGQVNPGFDAELLKSVVNRRVGPVVVPRSAATRGPVAPMHPEQLGRILRERVLRVPIQPGVGNSQVPSERLTFRCGGCRPGEVPHDLQELVAAGEPDAVALANSPAGAVHALLAALERRDVERYVGAMTEQFSFTSDDPDFMRAFPAGMSRDQERAFADHILGTRSSRRNPASRLPPGVVQLSIGPAIVALDGDGESARVALQHLTATISVDEDGSFAIADAWNEFRVVRTAAGWLVSAWHESHPTAQQRDSLVAGFAAPEPRDRTDRAPIAQDSVADALPARLALAARSDRAGNAFVFDVALPHAGGSLELFDVMGRRMAQRDLSELRPGLRTVRLDAAAIAPGVYWARVRQRGDAASARFVWVR